MDRQDIYNRLTPVCRAVFRSPDLVLTETLDATQVDTWTSLSFMQLLSKVEEEFGFCFKMMDLLRIRNIGTLVDCILSHQ